MTAEIDWPGVRAKAEKVPSVVALAGDNPDHQDFRSPDDSYSGFKVPTDAVCRPYFKATMDPDAQSSEFDDPVLSRPIAQKLVKIQHPEENTKAMVSAVRHLRDLHLQKAKSSLGEETVEALNFVYVFTYPAACSRSGQEELREAAI